MSRREYQLQVLGTPVAKGSMRSFAIRKGGKLTGKTVTVPGNAKGLADWHDRVALAAMQAVPNMTEGPVRLFLRFVFERPKGHPRKKGGLRPSAPLEKTTKPDVDKLQRAVMDALTGVVYRDDSQVVSATSVKRWADEDRPGLYAAIFMHAEDSE